jgi:hypothetical protein
VVKVVDDFARALTRHAALRHEAYAVARLDALRNGVCGPGLRITDIDATALKTWRGTWKGVHPSGAGKWDWENLLERAPHRPAVLPIALWYGSDLCGLAHGYASPHRASGVRHTISFTHIERRPEPPVVPLRGLIVPLAVNVGEAYGRTLGSSRIRLWNPDPRLLSYYRDALGFAVAWKSGRAVYCERRM